MTTLLQTLLLQTLPPDLDPVLLAYIKTVLPAVEEPGMISALNGLLTTWNLLPLLNSKFALSDDEKRLLCLGFTFQGYGHPCQSRTFELDTFWAEWREYLPEINYLAQITQQTVGKNSALARKTAYKIPERRLKLPLHQLLSLGTIAAQLTDPADIVTKPAGDRLREHLKALGIDRTLTYHRLRNCTGLLTNSIHNAVLHFTEKLDWQPLLFFAQGVVYLVPSDSELPDRSKVQAFLWEQISGSLATRMLNGKIGCKRAGQGLKVAPQALELIPPAQLIQNLPGVVAVTVKNETDPATLKRLARLDLRPTEREFLARGADLRSDLIAEFVIFLQKEFFGNNPEFITQVLDQLAIRLAITPEQTQVRTGGFYWGWYHAAAYYVASNPHLESEDVTAKLQDLANQLVTWAEEKKLLPVRSSSTREGFDRYLTQHLELPGWDNPEPSFQQELATYIAAKTKAAKQPICSLSSGEFASEEQMDSVVLFKPQQYSNKNPLGGRQLKRGISKIWSLEMLLRQAFWPIPAGKLEERQPIFLYLFPAFVHAPQVTKAIRLLVNQLKRVNLWEIRRFWQEQGMDSNALRFYPWLRDNPNPDENDKRDLPFIAVTYTTTNGKTTTDAWVEPAFLAIALPLLLGMKVVATASPVPLYNSSSEFSAKAQVDGPPSFWHLLGLPTSMHLEEEIQGQGKHLSDWLDRLLIAYSIHLDCQAKPPKTHWQAFPGTVQAISTNITAIFSLAHSHFQSLFDEKVQQYWQFAQIWATGDLEMEQQLELTQRLVQEYRTFYRVHVAKSTHAIVLPLSKVLEDILSTPSDLPFEDMLLQISGRLHDALRRQEPYERPLIMDQSLSFEIRVNNEIQAVHQFVKTCIKDLFLGQYKGDRALLQEHRNRIKSGAEFAYRLQAMQEPKSKTKKQEIEGAQR
ncbi:type I-D CRISPR-associated protein Cas10d/Csc3 [Kovacikia minuta CCNUW1]|uniref:type I-D CRISPR-associated protein Cas10d/Csc3 n=1 Tax=Kovacikia minuta TaxID=2931930 RepID=UPI001CCF49CD|nr:type I-D CRISPR-associated protein Cas10d/Csc3 [Kovacikia minuta]UBF28552.1 type I-D CRISPR-associated protein Cas10d/Csc3 [Kovacikia minuta CCNUW1]